MPGSVKLRHLVFNVFEQVDTKKYVCVLETPYIAEAIAAKQRDVEKRWIEPEFLEHGK